MVYAHPLTRGERVIAFIETLPVPDGEFVGKKIRLEEFQKSFIRDVYDRQNIFFTRDGDVVLRRIIRQAILTMARKNGKTTLIAGLLLAHLCGPESTPNAQLYSVAYEKEQAALIYKAAAGMVAMDEELSETLICNDSTKRIRHPESGSVYKALSRASKSKHGFNPTFVVFDELAQFAEDRELYDVLITSFGAQAEPLMVVISTQADTDAAVLSQLIDYGQQVMAGTIDDPTFYLRQYSTPIDADPFDEKHWKDANPALDVFRSLEEMQQFAKRAKMLPSLERTFRNLYLNQRVQSATVFISPMVWKANCGPLKAGTDEWKKLVESLAGRECFGGLDLSSKIDLTALVLIFPFKEEGMDIISLEFPFTHLVVLPFFWTPKDTILEREKRDKVPFFQWWKEGFLNATPGFAVEYGHIAAKIAELNALYKIRKIAADRWNLTQLKTRLVENGFKEQALEPDAGWLIPHGQGFKDMSPAVNVLEEALLGNRLHHGLHPVLTHNAASAVVDKDPAENRKFFKDKSTGRIDGIVALAMALNLAIGTGPKRKARGVSVI